MSEFINNHDNVSDRPLAAGELVDGGEFESRSLPSEGGALDKWTITPQAVPDDDTAQTFTLQVVDVTSAVQISFTTGTGTSKAAVAAAWLAAVQARPEFGNALKATIVADALVVESLRRDVLLKAVAVALGTGTVANTTPGTTSGDIGFGRFVLHASNRTACKAVVNGDTDGAGVALKYHINERDTSGNAAWRPGDAVPVLRRGRVKVELDVGVSIDASKSVFIRKGGSGLIGAFRDTADGGDAVALASYGFGGQWIGTNTTGLDGKNIATLQIWPN